jgi:hypothetical protein
VFARSVTFFATLGLLLVAVAPAHAAFPGENGKIVFSRPSATCNPYLYTINPDGTGEARITTDPAGDGQDPTWSADGRRLVFESSWQCPDPAGNYREIHVMNGDGTGRIRLTNDSRHDYDPTWSPAGDRVAYVRSLAIPNHPCGQIQDIIYLNPDGTGWTRATNSHSSESDLDWHPGGSTLSFTLYEFYPDEYCEGPNSWPTLWTFSGPVTNFPTTQADYSSDGQRWVARGNGNYLMIINGPDLATPAVGSSPVWSPNGALIAYLRDGDIWVMNADGSNQHPVTSTPEPEGQLDWQPLLVPHVRPAGASPFRVSLVPAAKYCDSTGQNREHGPPLAFPSCAPPQPGSSNLTVGTGDGSPALARSVGFLRLAVSPGAPGGPDDTDVGIRFSLSNVMRASDLSEYTGELRTRVKVRLTDRNAGVSQTTEEWPESDWELAFNVPCTPTDASLDKSLCAVATTVDAIMPGAAAEGERALWALDQVKVYDSGPDEDPDTDWDNSLFAVQGVFVP